MFALFTHVDHLDNLCIRISFCFVLHYLDSSLFLHAVAIFFGIRELRTIICPDFDL